jgi:hypothetical protein
VRVRRLVGLDVLGDDREVDRNSELLLRRGDQVAVGVREDREHPATVPELPERRRHLRERRPVRQRVGERPGLTFGELDAFLAEELLERQPEHLAVGAVLLGLDLRLELVVALEQPRRRLDAEDPPSSVRIPSSSRSASVAIERRPALPRHIRAP